MGQQQLLLIVIGIIVVGFAVITGMEIAEKSFMMNDADILVNRCLTIAQDAISWKTKNDPFVGGKASYAGLQTGGFEQLFLIDETETGFFKLGNVTSNSFDCFAVSKRFSDVGVRLSVVGDEIVITETSYIGGITLP